MGKAEAHEPTPRAVLWRRGRRRQPTHLAYASSTDNGTWNKTGFFSEVNIDMPSIEERRKLVAAVGIAGEYSRRLDDIQRRLNDLLSKEIDVVDCALDLQGRSLRRASEAWCAGMVPRLADAGSMA